jgi:hypothetical protein
MQNFIITFPEQGMLSIQDNAGNTVLLNPKQAIDLMDFLLKYAELIRGYMSTDELEVGAWEAYQNAIEPCECGVEGCKGLEGIIPDELSEAERLSLLEPTPFDSGICRCGAFVEAGRLHEHQCS